MFYLYNRVQGIYRKAEWIRSMFPDITVAVGHGKMKEDELEDIMYDMVNGKTARTCLYDYYLKQVLIFRMRIRL